MRRLALPRLSLLSHSSLTCLVGGHEQGGDDAGDEAGHGEREGHRCVKKQKTRRTRNAMQCRAGGRVQEGGLIDALRLEDVGRAARRKSGV